MAEEEGTKRDEGNGTGRGKMKGQVREGEAIRNPLPKNQILQRTRMGEPPTQKANETHHGEKGNRREHPKDEKREGWEEKMEKVRKTEKRVATAKKCQEKRMKQCLIRSS